MVVMFDDSLTERKRIMNMEQEREQAHARGHRLTKDLLQDAATLLWKVATSGDQAVERSDADAYQAAESLTRSLYFASYADATEDTWQRVRDLLAELGPDDSYRDVDSHGVDSYHKGALREQARQREQGTADRFGDAFGEVLREALDARREVATELGTSERDFVEWLRAEVRDQFRAYGY